MGTNTGHAHRRLCAAISCAALLTFAASYALAQQAPGAASPAAPPSPAAAAAKATEAAKKAYDVGVKSYQSGKHQAAIDSLSTALRGGGLASGEMARALYIRGLAYKKLNKPGLAISDLTSALWLKNGLSDADRKSATAERAEAYKTAGLGDGNSGADQVAVADPNVSGAEKGAGKAPPAAVNAPPAATAPAPVPQAAEAASPTAAAAPSSSSGGVPQPLSIGGDTTPPPPPAAVANKSEGGVIDQSAALEQPRVVSTPSQPATQTAAAEPAATPPAPAGGSGIGAFFSNLFSSSGSGSTGAEAQKTAPPATTASTNEPAPATSSWASSNPPGQTVAAPSKAMKQAAVKEAANVTPAAAAPASAAPAAAKPSGKYKAHIAAFRTRAEAEALAQKLSQQHGGALQSRAPTVDEAVIGSMGTFYRVRIGGYASAEEPRGLCNTLRNSGYDCLVVSN